MARGIAPSGEYTMKKTRHGTDYYALEVAAAAHLLKTDLEQGLTAHEVQVRAARYGLNAIADAKQRSALLIFLTQFKSPIVYLLVFAAGLSIYFEEWLDGGAILVVILINALIGFYMEYQASRSMDALKKLTVLPAKVMRGGVLNEIDSAAIVPGDVIFLDAGDMIPADGRIFKSNQLIVNESALTGESIPADKDEATVPAGAALADRKNMLYKGTFSVKGNAWIMVTATAMSTELGQIASMVQTADQASTPLEKKLQRFTKTLIIVTLVLLALIFLAGIINGKNVLEMFETSIALAVAAIPEGLPIVATMALAQGMMKMAKHKVIVKKLSAVETLGGTNVICTDKTGTLTQNKIAVASMQIPGTQEAATTSKNAEIILHTGILCSTAELVQKKGKPKEIGDPLEVGLLNFAVKQGADIAQLRQDHPKLSEEAFTSETKVMATLHADGQGYVVYAKGATEEILKICNRILEPDGEQTMPDSSRKHWLQTSEELSARGLRVIAVAYKQTDTKEGKLTDELVFAGLLALNDPPRPEINAAIRECHKAGITVIMITGDHPAAAKNIALQLEIVDSESATVIIGNEMHALKGLSHKEKTRWADTRIFARVSPKQKLDLVTLLQAQGNVVGMTGDGVNDAPALQKADIGIAMGKSGTQVAQDVADMVLKDDSFASIVKAIRQGRIIVENIKKFIVYLLSCNLSELAVVSAVSIANLQFQLFPIQILFINLITDVLPALALGVTEGNPDIMKRKPIDAADSIINPKRWVSIVVYSLIISAASLGAVYVSGALLHPAVDEAIALGNNSLLLTLIFSQLFHVFNMGQTGTNFFKSEVFRNKYVWAAIGSCLLLMLAAYLVVPVRTALSISTISLPALLISLGMACAGTLVIQILKTLRIVGS